VRVDEVRRHVGHHRQLIVEVIASRGGDSGECAHAAVVVLYGGYLSGVLLRARVALDRNHVWAVAHMRLAAVLEWDEAC